MSRWITHDGRTLTAAGWARLTGQNPTTILRQLAAGLTPRDLFGAKVKAKAQPAPSHSRSVTPPQRAELVRRYAEERADAVATLSAEWVLAKSTLYRELAVAGAPPPSHLTPGGVEEARKRILEGASMRSEAKRLGVNVSTLSRALAKRAEIG